MLQDQLESVSSSAQTLNADLQQSDARCRSLANTLDSTQTELDSALEQSSKQEAERQSQRAAAAAQEADSAAELESARAQAAQLNRQLSERIQRLDVLQVRGTYTSTALAQNVRCRSTSAIKMFCDETRFAIVGQNHHG